jgi:hypothetical protein
VIVRVAVEGDPATTSAVPAGLPSSRKFTVPLGAVAPGPARLIVAVNCSGLPTEGVVDDGVSTTVGVFFETFSGTAIAVEFE